MKEKFPEKYYSFSCTRCGYCCCEEGYVYFTEEEIDKASNILNMGRQDFIFSYLEKDEFAEYYHIVEKNSCCSFLIDNLCIIQEDKPSQCSTFPYWDEYMDINGNILKSKFKRKCPGIK